ncbi:MULTISPECIES: glycoside hydrolase family 26 protein [unclassified Nocardioides]|uniref:glycoside hydrolase family 26 protein n=1 Tax=unclassified Nocardioides TaxID=2615069 RepID=UPI0009EF9069|nr:MULTISPECIES: glycosyl hydrolase [unclassified Nocardioides]GAW49314.1 glycoside hydrolase family protein [Nocardioides sp. PD653-B2]GAW55802.1 glycoside hydrolase family protein [Nocardioides sp. PD653]
MRPSAAVEVLLAGLLTGGLIASGATPVHARPLPVEKVATTLTARLAPPVVIAGEPASLVAQLTPARTRSLTVETLSDGVWSTLGNATSNGAGRAVVPLDTSMVGSQVLRIVAPAQGNLPVRRSAPAVLKVTDPATCTPKPALVDPLATPAARCLAARLDSWRSTGLMGVGQQLNVSSSAYAAPLTALGNRRVSVVGFDLQELALSGTYEFPFQDQVLADLAALARSGVVLSASWHATNPGNGNGFSDRGWHDLDALLDSSTPEYAEFWSDFDAKMALLGQLQDAGAAVVFRPFHEANGDWFWWGHPDPATYRHLWRLMQERAAADGVHNIVWGYSFAAKVGSWIRDPAKLLPAKVDLAGIDAYDPEAGAGNAKDLLPTQGYAAIAARVKRMAMTEVGPHGSVNGTWNPAVVTRTAKTLTSSPLWAMLWFDDRDGKKQISSLAGGRSWLGSCPNAFCYLR